LENYQIYFGASKSNPIKAFITEAKDSVMFLKLYLITKDQFIEILKKGYSLEFDEKVLFNEHTKQGRLTTINLKTVNYF